MKEKETRIERILKRAIAYNNGVISADTFALLESAEEDAEADIRHISFGETNTLLDVLDNKGGIKTIYDVINKNEDKSTQSEDDAEPYTLPKFPTTLEKFNAMTLDEQQAMYNKYPEEITKLIKTKGYTRMINKDTFNKLPLSDQQRIYNEAPEMVQALLENKVEYIDAGESK